MRSWTLVAVFTALPLVLEAQALPDTVILRLLSDQLNTTSSISGPIAVHTGILRVYEARAVATGHYAVAHSNERAAAIRTVPGLRPCTNSEIRTCLWVSYRHLLQLSAAEKRADDYVLLYSFTTRATDTLADFITAEATLRLAKGQWVLTGHQILSGGQLQRVPGCATSCFGDGAVINSAYDGAQRGGCRLWYHCGV